HEAEFPPSATRVSSGATVETTGTTVADRLAQAMPGGVLGTFVPDDPELVIERAAGTRVYDAKGREYVDFVLGSGPLVLGHAHPAVVAAIEEQARRGTQYYAMNPRALELAERIVDAVP